MLTFLLILVLVFAAVDLFVQLVIDPLASKRKSERVKKISTSNIEPIISVVGATMYDGGKSNHEEKDKSGGKNVNGEKSSASK